MDSPKLKQNVFLQNIGGSLTIRNEPSDKPIKVSGHMTRHGQSEDGTYVVSAAASATVIVNADSDLSAQRIGGSASMLDLNGDIAVSKVGGSLSVTHTNSIAAGKVGGGIDATHVEDYVAAQTIGGGVKLSHVGGEVKLSSIGGGVKLNHVEGDIQAAGIGGGVDAHFLNGNIEINKVGGDVHVSDIDGDCTLLEIGDKIYAKLDFKADNTYRLSARKAVNIVVDDDTNATFIIPSYSSIELKDSPEPARETDDGFIHLKFGAGEAIVNIDVYHPHKETDQPGPWVVRLQGTDANGNVVIDDEE